MASLKEYAEHQYLQKILKDSVDNLNVDVSSEKYKKIKDYNVEDYTYVYHKVKWLYKKWKEPKELCM